MTNWINRHVGEVCVAGFAVLAAGAVGLGNQLGQNEAKLNAQAAQTAAIIEKMEAQTREINARFDELRIDLAPDDLKSILVATGTVGPADVFWAAVVNDSVWVFPSENLKAQFAAKGMAPEQVTWFLSGFKVLPAGAIRQ